LYIIILNIVVKFYNYITIKMISNMYHIKYKIEICYLTHWLLSYILTLYDRRLENDQERSQHVACVISIAENTCSKSHDIGIYFL
jgi:hypothetical protein